MSANDHVECGHVAYDADSKEFEVGDWALHISNQLDSREVVAILDANIISLAIGAEVVMVPAENYIKQAKL